MHPRDANGHKKILKSGDAVIGSSHVTTLGSADGAAHQIEVRPTSGRPTKPCCITHGVIFDKVADFKAHTAEKGDHVVARWCPEVVKENRGVDAFGAPVYYEGPYGLESEKAIDQDYREG